MDIKEFMNMEGIFIFSTAFERVKICKLRNIEMFILMFSSTTKNIHFDTLLNDERK